MRQLKACKQRHNERHVDQTPHRFEHCWYARDLHGHARVNAEHVRAADVLVHPCFAQYRMLA